MNTSKAIEKSNSNTANNIQANTYASVKELSEAVTLFNNNQIEEAHSKACEILKTSSSQNSLAIDIIWAATEKTKIFSRTLELIQLLEIERPLAIDTLILRMRLSAYCHQPQAAGNAIEKLIDKTLNVSQLDDIFSNIVKIEPPEKPKHYLNKLLQKTINFRNTNNVEKDAASVLLAKILFAMNDFMNAEKIIRQIKEPQKYPLVRLMASIIIGMKKDNYPDYLAPKVFGIGLSKTGTVSLHEALSFLGYRSLHWRNTITLKLISPNDFFDFDAFSDTSVCYNFEYLYFTFPNAKFIYTERPIKDWARSFIKHFNELGETFEEMVANMNKIKDKKYGQAWDISHKSLYFNYASPEIAYTTFDERVNAFFSNKAPDKLLKLNIFKDDSWSKICHFLEKDIPNIPFPHRNKSA